MKLFRKLYLQVFLGMFILAVCLLSFSAWEVKRQGILEAREYGTGQAERNALRFQEKNAEEKINVLGDHLRDIVILNNFQECFGSNSVLWRDGEELRNLSPYILDQELLDEMRRNARVSETEVFVSGPFAAGERRLLVFYKARAGFGEENTYGFAIFQDVTELYGRVRKLVLWGMAFAGILLFVISLLLYKKLYGLLRPLEELKSGAADIAAGEYESRILVRGRDEIGDVTKSFNQMAEQVERHMEELRKVNEKQKQLLGSLAHEMKTPLTAMIGNADLLLTVRLKEEQREQSLTYILEESKRLSSLSENMLELTGLNEKGGAGSIIKSVEIGRLFGRLEGFAAFRLKEKRLSLEMKKPEAGLSALMDEDLMESLLLNLVDNACKASETG